MGKKVNKSRDFGSVRIIWAVHEEPEICKYWTVHHVDLFSCQSFFHSEIMIRDNSPLLYNFSWESRYSSRFRQSIDGSQCMRIIEHKYSSSLRPNLMDNEHALFAPPCIQIPYIVFIHFAFRICCITSLVGLQMAGFWNMCLERLYWLTNQSRLGLLSKTIYIIY